MGSRRRWNLWLHPPGRARPHRAGRERRPVDDRQLQAALQASPGPRRAEGLRRRVDGSVHPATLVRRSGAHRHALSASMRSAAGRLRADVTETVHACGERVRVVAAPALDDRLDPPSGREEHEGRRRLDAVRVRRRPRLGIDEQADGVAEAAGRGEGARLRLPVLRHRRDGDAAQRGEAREDVGGRGARPALALVEEEERRPARGEPGEVDRAPSEDEGLRSGSRGTGRDGHDAILRPAGPAGNGLPRSALRAALPLHGELALARRGGALRLRTVRDLLLRAVPTLRRHERSFRCDSAALVRRRAARRYSSQSRSFSFLGRYSSVMKLIPRRLSASSSNFCPLFTISSISCCHCFAWNQGYASICFASATSWSFILMATFDGSLYVSLSKEESPMKRAWGTAIRIDSYARLIEPCFSTE